MTRVAKLILVALMLGAAIGGCGGNEDKKASPPGRTIYAGEVGVLPAPSTTSAGPRLVLPPKSVTVRGDFPLDPIVKFNAPVRNDGRKPLLIRKLDPG